MESYEGGCFCGAIRYRFRSVFDAGYCHCSICRRISGAPVLTWVNTPADGFSVVRGTPKWLSTSERFERAFCSDCGTHLFTRSKTPGDWTYVSMNHGTIDRAQEIEPKVHLCYADRLPWLELADDFLRVEGNALPHPATR